VPLLNRVLINNFKSEVPDSVLEKLNSLQKNISFHNLALSASLINVISLFNKSEIDVLPIKGPILAERLYGSCSMRTYGDIDILVRKRDIGKALDILLQNNFVLLPEGIPRSTYDRFMKHAYHGRLLDANGITIELHWELTGFYVSGGITFESIEPYLLRTRFCGCPSLDLMDEMLLLYLCIHGIKHHYEKLDYICSIVGLLSIAPDMNWSLVFELGRKFKITRGIRLSLTLADRLFSLPASVQREQFVANGPDLSTFADKMIEWNMSIYSERDITNPFQKNSVYQSAVFDSKMEQTKFLLKSKFVPHQDEWDKMKLPNAMFYLYFLNKIYQVGSLSISNRLRILLGKINCSKSKHPCEEI
jgi:hypothetical protein